MFPLLGESPLLGTNFTAEDARANNTVMLSYGFWQERFGGDRDVLGKQIALGGRSRTVIAVMPRGFEFPTSETRVWTPFELGPAYIASGPDRRYRIERFYGTRASEAGRTPAQATAEGSARLNAVKFATTTTSCLEIFKAQGSAPASRLSRCSTGWSATSSRRSGFCWPPAACCLPRRSARS